jgi:hypothetical protein
LYSGHGAFPANRAVLDRPVLEEAKLLGIMRIGVMAIFADLWRETDADRSSRVGRAGRSIQWLCHFARGVKDLFQIDRERFALIDQPSGGMG